MSLLNYWYDTAARRKRGVAYPGFVDYDETVTGSAKQTFQLTVDIDAGHQIDVWVDGRMQLEGTAWTRDNTNNRVSMTSNVNVGSWFRARTYLK